MRIWTKDIGNTRTKAIVFEFSDRFNHGGLIGRDFVPGFVPLAKWKNDRTDTIAFEGYYEGMRTPEHKTAFCRVSSGGGIESGRELTNTNCPIDIDYNTPETLGTDRLAAALGACLLSDGMKLIVDIGTFITCDLVDTVEGIFHGGAIMPGPRLLSKTLATAGGLRKHSDLKPEDVSNPTPFPGKSTADSIMTGLHRQTAGVIEHFLGQADSAIFTGGDGEPFARLFNALYDPILTNKGLLLFHLQTGER